ncbi:MAG: archease [Candidatus Micrarchaeia archaeon]
MAYRYLPHTADMKFVAYGRTFEEALENAAKAMLNIMLDIKKIKKEKAEEKTLAISEKARTIEDLVWYTLQDILARIDEKALNAYAFNVVKYGHNSDYFVQGRLAYKDMQKDFSLIEVKAVTQYMLKVENRRGRWSITAVVDV